MDASEPWNDRSKSIGDSGVEQQIKTFPGAGGWSGSGAYLTWPSRKLRHWRLQSKRCRFQKTSDQALNPFDVREQRRDPISQSVLPDKSESSRSVPFVSIYLRKPNPLAAERLSISSTGPLTNGLPTSKNRSGRSISCVMPMRTVVPMCAVSRTAVPIQSGPLAHRSTPSNRVEHQRDRPYALLALDGAIKGTPDKAPYFLNGFGFYAGFYRFGQGQTREVSEDFLFRARKSQPNPQPTPSW